MTDTVTGYTQDAVEAPVIHDYFSFTRSDKFMLPDGIQWMQVEAMNEGAKAKFQKNTSRDVKLDRRDGSASMKVDSGGDRHALIIASVKDWNLFRQGQMIPFSERNLRELLTLGDPKLIDELEVFIRKMNPWMLEDLTANDIQEQIDELEELKKIALEREAGEVSSSSK